VSSTKLILTAVGLTILSVVIGGSTVAYVGYRKAQEKLGVSGSDLGRTLSTFTNFEETLADIAGTDGGEFGKRASKLRDRYPFQRPPSGALTEPQVQAFIAVKDALLAIDQEMQADMIKEPSREPGISVLTKWNFFTRLQRLRMAQIAELERRNMTVEEYNWVHYEIYKVLVSEGALPRNDQSDWRTVMSETIDRSARAIDDELSSSETTPERRRELETIRATMAESRDFLTGVAAELQEELRSIPSENRSLVEQYQSQISNSFMSAIDLDAIDIMKGMENAEAR
jgi:hypothetical protein